MATCGRLRAAIVPHLTGGQRLVVDLSGVTVMGASALAFLDHARSTLAADRGSFTLRNPSIAAHELLSLSGMARFFDTEIG